MATLDVNGLSIKTNHTWFLDTMGLMALSGGTTYVVTNDLEKMNFESKAKITGYGNSTVVVMYYSCNKSLPSIFGDKMEDIDLRSLPKCKTFVDWDKQYGHSSFMDTKLYNIDGEVDLLNDKYLASLSSTAQLVATTYITKYHRCLKVCPHITYVDDIDIKY